MKRKFKYGSGAFNEYAISNNNVRDKCKHKNTLATVKCKNFCRQPTLNFICLNKQSTTDDEGKAEDEGRDSSAYLRNYENRHSSLKFSV